MNNVGSFDQFTDHLLEYIDEEYSGHEDDWRGERRPFIATISVGSELEVHEFQTGLIGVPQAEFVLTQNIFPFILQRTAARGYAVV